MRRPDRAVTLAAIAACLVSIPHALSAAEIGRYTFDEGAGTTVGDSSGNGNNGTLGNEFGGLGVDGAAWVTDADRGAVLSFDGLATAAYVELGEIIPLLTLEADATILLWVKSNVAASVGAQRNSVIVGNRFMQGGGEFSPREFMKLTPRQFEYHRDEAGENVDFVDLPVGEWHHLAVVKDGVNLTVYYDGLPVATRAVTAPLNNQQPVYFGGDPSGTTNERFNGFIDDVVIYDEARTGAQILADAGLTSPPVAVGSPVVADALLVGGSLSLPLTDFVSDVDSPVLMFSKASGPPWMDVAPSGLVTGTPAIGDVGLNDMVVAVSDGATTIDVTVRVEVFDGAVPEIEILGRWLLDEGSGTLADDSSGLGSPAEVLNAASGGLGAGGNGWIADPVMGTVLTSAGGAAGVSVTVGDLPGDPVVPMLALDSDFTWMFFARTEQNPGNQIIVGNRFAPDGTDTDPLEFVKFTNNAFEWRANNLPENIDYPDIPIGEWHHHAVVKKGDSLSYYRDGSLLGARFITQVPATAIPLYFGGQNGLEVWRGALSDVRIYDGAFQPSEVADVVATKSATALGFVAVDVQIVGGNVVLTWRSDPGETYDVECSEFLDTGNWNPVLQSVASQGFATTVTVPDSRGSLARFYRAVAPLPVP